MMGRIRLKIRNNDILSQKMRWVCFILIFTLLAGSFAMRIYASPGVVKLLSYQGRLMNNSNQPVPDAAYRIGFKIYQGGTGTGASCGGGTEVWQESYDEVETTNGVFSVELGSVNSLDLNFSDDTYWLSIKVGTDSEMNPCTRITSFAQAINSDLIDGYHAADIAVLSRENTFSGKNNFNYSGSSTAFQINNLGAGNSFVVANNDTNAPFVIDNLGNMGVGTSSLGSRLTVAGNVLLSGADNYLNFGSLPGTNGYGFRDNGGVMQIKNASGSWSDIGSGTGVVGSGLTGYIPYYSAAGTSLTATSSLFIDSSGKIGIGTTSPSYTLDISSNNYQQIRTVRPDSTGTSVWSNVLYSTSSFGPNFQTEMYGGTVASPVALGSGIHFLTLSGKGYDGSSLYDSAIAYFDTTESWTPTARGSKIDFWTTPTGTASRVRSMTISGNNIGIGTATPGQLLDVNGTSRINGAYVYNGGSGVEINTNTSSIPLVIQARRMTDLSTATVGNTLINPNNGTVGIGVLYGVTPEAKLHVSGGGSASIISRIIVEAIGNGGTGRGTGILFRQPNGSGSTLDAAKIAGVDSGFVIHTGAAGALSERLRIDSDGNVGIGIANPGDYNVRAKSLVVGHTDAAYDGMTIVTSTTGNGNINFADGTVTTAAYRGIVRYDHSDDSMQFHTSGSERVRITNLGNVGIGTTSPVAKLHIDDGSAAQWLFSTTAGVATLDFRRNDTSIIPGNPLGHITFKGNDTTGNAFMTHAEIRALAEATHSAGSNSTGLAFYTTPSGSETAAEVLRISNTGNVGIGTTSPQSVLHLFSNNASGFLIERSSNLNSSIQYKNTIGSMYAGLSSSADFGIGNNSDIGTAFLTVKNSSGNVGIGTVAPASKLEVYENTTGTVTRGDFSVNTTAKIVTVGRLSSTSGDNTTFNVVDRSGNIKLQVNSGGVGVQGSAVGNTMLYVSSVPTSGANSFGLQVNAPVGSTNNHAATFMNGNVGIGTTSPSANLHVYNGTGISAFRIDNGVSTDAGAYSQLQFFASGSGAPANQKNFSILNLNDTANGNKLQIQSRNDDGTYKSQLVTITNNGNVGIGTASPGAPLHVYGSSAEPLIVERSSSANSGIQIKSTSGSVYIGNRDGTDFSVGTNADLTSSTKFTVLSNGNVGIGTTSPEAKLHVSGGNLLLDNARIIQFKDNTGVLKDILKLSNGNYTFIYNNGGTAGITLEPDADVAIGDSSQLVVKDGGNVGIGTTSPASRLHVSVAPTASANNGTLSVGGGAFDGSTSGYFVGNANGTSIAVNEASGYSGDLIGLSLAGSNKFKVNQLGTVTSGFGFKSAGITSHSGSLDDSYFISSWTLAGNNQQSNAFQILPTYNQPSATGVKNTDLLINRTETSLGTTPGAQYLIDAQVGGVSKFRVANEGSTYINGYAYVTNIGTNGSNSTLHILGRYSNSTAGNGINLGYTGDAPSHNWTNTSGQVNAVTIMPTYNQTSGTAANTDLLINRTETAIGSGAQNLIDTQVGGVTKFNISNIGNGYFAGKVGIGTTSPASKLHVVGTDFPMARFDRAPSGATNIIYSVNGLYSMHDGDMGDGFGAMQVFGGQDSGSSGIQSFAAVAGVRDGGDKIGKLVLRANNNDTWVDALTIKSTGNVGIGTTSPDSKIHGVTTLSAATGDEVAYRLDYTTNKLTSGDDTGLLINMTDTASPGASFFMDMQVGGLSKFSVQNTGNIFTSGGVTINSGALSVANNTLVRPYGGSTTLNSVRLVPTNAYTRTSGSASIFTIEPTYNQTSGTAANTDLLINRTETAIGSGAQNLIDAQVGGVSKFRVVNEGSVYTNTIYVGGTIKKPNAARLSLQNDITFSTAGAVGISIVESSIFSQTSGNNMAVRILPTYNQTSGTAANTDLLINRTETAVGSGSQYLIDAQVGGTSKFSVSNMGDVQIKGSGNTSYYKAGDTTNGVDVWFGVSSAARGFIGTMTNHGLGFRTNNVDRLQIDTSGNVGIGTTTPSVKMHIYGTSNTLRMSYDSTKFGEFSTDSSGNNLWHSTGFVQMSGDNEVGDLSGQAGDDLNIIGDPSGSLNKGVRIKAYGADANWYTGLQYLNLSTGMPNLSLVPSGGNVGIGTTSPFFKLDVFSNNNSLVRFLNTATSSNIQGSGIQAFSDDGDALAAGDRLGFFVLGGSKDSSHTLANAVAMTGFTTENWTSTSTGARIAFEGTLAGASSRNEWMTLFEGRLGIGTSSPAYILDVQHASSKVNSKNGYLTNGADYAEYFYTEDTDLAAGEAVCLDKSISKAIKRCNIKGDSSVIGVISDNPSIVGNGNGVERDKDSHYKIVGMVGQIKTKVSNVNGEIKIGDYLMASETGTAIKATEATKVIGMAMENYNAQEDGIINVLVSPHWSLDGLLDPEAGVASSTPDGTDVLDKFTEVVKKSLGKLGILIENGMTKISRLVTDRITTKELCVDDVCINKEQLKTILENNPAVQVSSPPSEPEASSTPETTASSTSP